ncbi:MAG: large subunit ribosomal protein L32 [Chlamydiales bacterium]|jgi:large subunit ribosomal protein L32
MAVPRNRTSNSRKNTRRAHDAKTPISTSSCSNCGEQKLPHVLCNSCGFYNGRAVVELENNEE